MSPKKIHEVPLPFLPFVVTFFGPSCPGNKKVERMSKLVVEVCKAVGADTVVDIGAGEVNKRSIVHPRSHMEWSYTAGICLPRAISTLRLQSDRR